MFKMVGVKGVGVGVGVPKLKQSEIEHGRKPGSISAPLQTKGGNGGGGETQGMFKMVGVKGVGVGVGVPKLKQSEIEHGRKPGSISAPLQTKGLSGALGTEHKNKTTVRNGLSSNTLQPNLRQKT